MHRSVGEYEKGEAGPALGDFTIHRINSNLWLVANMHNTEHKAWRSSQEAEVI